MKTKINDKERDYFPLISFRFGGKMFSGRKNNFSSSYFSSQTDSGNLLFPSYLPPYLLPLYFY